MSEQDERLKAARRGLLESAKAFEVPEFDHSQLLAAGEEQVARKELVIGLLQQIVDELKAIREVLESNPDR